MGWIDEAIEYQLFDLKIKIHSKDFEVVDQYVNSIVTLLHLSNLSYSVDLHHGKDVLLKTRIKGRILSLRFLIRPGVNFLNGIRFKSMNHNIVGLFNDFEYRMEKPLKAFLIEVGKYEEISS